MKLLVNGHAAYAYTGGKDFDASLPCVVFIHGALHDHSAWTLLARWCAHHGHSVLALDLPGHGGSLHAPLGDVAHLADWLLALLDAAGVRRATLVGHSMGSLIALEATARDAAKNPGRIAGLVMMATAYPMKVADALLATALSEPLRAIDMVNAWSFSTYAAKPSFPGPGMSLHGSNRALMRRMQAAAAALDSQANVALPLCLTPGGGNVEDMTSGGSKLNLFHHEFSVCNGYANGLVAAAQRRCPVHFILGAQDQMTPTRATRELAAALQATVLTIDAGHNLVAEAPDAVLAALRQALRASAPHQVDADSVPSLK